MEKRRIESLKFDAAMRVKLDFPDTHSAFALMRKMEEFNLEWCIDISSSNLEDRIYYRAMKERLDYFSWQLQENLSERVTFLDIDEEELRRSLPLMSVDPWEKKSDDTA